MSQVEMAAGFIQSISGENLPLVVFVDGCALFGGDIRLLSQVNQNVPRAFLRVAIPTAVLVLEELCVRSNPFRAQPQVITMLE